MRILRAMSKKTASDRLEKDQIKLDRSKIVVR